jgi:hypothetical protein
MTGSIVWNNAMNRFEPFPYGSMGRSGLTGTVFVDANQNGWRDPDETAVHGLRLRSRDKTAETDAQGRYSLWNLTPFERTDVSIVSSSLRNPLLVPQFNRASLALGPNGFQELNLPMIRGTEVLGRFLRINSPVGAGMGGVEIVLHQVETGRNHETVTFHDGAFYFMSLPPGEYEISVPPRQLHALGLSLEDSSRWCIIPVTGDSDEAFQLEVRLVAEPNSSN